MTGLKNLKYLLPDTRVLLEELVNSCRLFIMPEITFKLFATALIYMDDIEDDDIDFLEPIEKLSKGEIRDYFQRELKKWRN